MFKHGLVVQDKQRILEGCCELVPSLKHAQVVADWAGLRPARDRVRLELEHHQVQLPACHPPGTVLLSPQTCIYTPYLKLCSSHCLLDNLCLTLCTGRIEPPTFQQLPFPATTDGSN